MTNNQTLPCINCITLAICKSIVMTRNYLYPKVIETAVVLLIFDKCKLAEDYCLNPKRNNKCNKYSYGKIHEIAEYLITKKKRT